MFKIVRNQFSPLILRICPFSSSKVNAQVMEKTKPKLFCKLFNYSWEESVRLSSFFSQVLIVYTQWQSE